MFELLEEIFYKIQQINTFKQYILDVQSTF